MIEATERTTDSLIRAGWFKWTDRNNQQHSEPFCVKTCAVTDEPSRQQAEDAYNEQLTDAWYEIARRPNQRGLTYTEDHSAPFFGGRTDPTVSA